MATTELDTMPEVDKGWYGQNQGWLQLWACSNMRQVVDNRGIRSRWCQRQIVIRNSWGKLWFTEQTRKTEKNSALRITEETRLHKQTWTWYLCQWWHWRSVLHSGFRWQKYLQKPQKRNHSSRKFPGKFPSQQLFSHSRNLFYISGWRNQGQIQWNRQ